MTFHLLQLQNMPILEQLRLEEALLRADDRNWILINRGSPPAIVMGISGKPINCIATLACWQVTLRIWMFLNRGVRSLTGSDGATLANITPVLAEKVGLPTDVWQLPGEEDQTCASPQTNQLGAAVALSTLAWMS